MVYVVHYYAKDRAQSSSRNSSQLSIIAFITSITPAVVASFSSAVLDLTGVPSILLVWVDSDAISPFLLHLQQVIVPPPLLISAFQIISAFSNLCEAPSSFLCVISSLFHPRMPCHQLYMFHQQCCLTLVGNYVGSQAVPWTSVNESLMPCSSPNWTCSSATCCMLLGHSKMIIYHETMGAEVIQIYFIFYKAISGSYQNATRR